MRKMGKIMLLVSVAVAGGICFFKRDKIKRLFTEA